MIDRRIGNGKSHLPKTGRQRPARCCSGFIRRIGAAIRRARLLGVRRYGSTIVYSGQRGPWRTRPRASERTPTTRPSREGTTWLGPFPDRFEVATGPRPSAAVHRIENTSIQRPCFPDSWSRVQPEPREHTTAPSSSWSSVFRLGNMSSTIVQQKRSANCDVFDSAGLKTRLH